MVILWLYYGYIMLYVDIGCIKGCNNVCWYLDLKSSIYQLNNNIKKTAKSKFYRALSS